jgi:hypothetical protein
MHYDGGWYGNEEDLDPLGEVLSECEDLMQFMLKTSWDNLSFVLSEAFIKERFENKE